MGPVALTTPSFKSTALVLLALILGCTREPSAAPHVAAPAQSAPARFRPYARPVTTWVPPYGIARAKARLTDPAIGMGDALTHLALQFWVPTAEGDVVLVKHPDVTDAAVSELRDWAHANGVRAMLCVYNAGGRTWDWSLARSAFDTHRAKFVRSLVAEVDRLGLDGVDVDLEGGGSFPQDKAAFVSFIAELSAALHARGKHLSVDTFAYRWNAPNQTWWPELLPLVDALTTMGYHETGANADGWRSYAAQREAAGDHAAKLQIGMPSGKDQWLGKAAREHLEWVRRDGTVGVAIWDAQLRTEAWRSPELWRVLREIRGPAK